MAQVLFSATFPPQVEALAKQVLERPIEITVGGRSAVNNDVKQVIEVRSEESKMHRLLQLLGVWCVIHVHLYYRTPLGTL